MQWVTNSELLEVGRTRMRRRFLWVPTRLPRLIGGMTVREWRWLQSATVYQEVASMDVGGSMEWGKVVNAWTDVGWVD